HKVERPLDPRPPAFDLFSLLDKGEFPALAEGALLAAGHDPLGDRKPGVYPPLPFFRRPLAEPWAGADEDTLSLVVEVGTAVDEGVVRMNEVDPTPFPVIGQLVEVADEAQRGKIAVFCPPCIWFRDLGGDGPGHFRHPFQ